MKTVAVVFGGQSTEHDVSIVTALGAIIKPLESLKKYRVEAIYITKDGRWFNSDKLKDISLYQSKAIDQFLLKNPPVDISLNNGLEFVKTSKFKKQRTKVDVVFPAMHGTNGEDGALMGLLQMANVPYVGCDLQSSVVAMDKILAKQVAKGAGLKTVKDVIFSQEEYAEDSKKILDRIEKELNFPAFVKPPHLGSSIGVTKVNNRDELENAIEVSLHYDKNVLVEMAVPNLREATLPIMGYGDEIIPAKLEEPLFASDDFFDFDTKYIGDGKKGGGKKGGKRGAQGYSNIPANFSKKMYDEAEAVGLAGYKAAGCCGTARVDILINEKTGDIFFNEINPLPGSLYNHNWRVAGYSPSDLVEKLIYFAQKRHSEEQKLETAFSTSFLKQF